MGEVETISFLLIVRQTEASENWSCNLREVLAVVCLKTGCNLKFDRNGR